MKKLFKKAKYAYLILSIIICTIIVNVGLVVYLETMGKNHNHLVIVIVAIINCLMILSVGYFVQNSVDTDDAKIKELAYKDFETNCHNLNYYIDYYKDIVKNIGYGKCCFICLDVDNFKYVNNIMGHDTGNDIINIIAGVLEKRTTDREIVIRVNGDVFGIILEENNKDIITERVHSILDEAKREVAEAYTDRVNISFSSGVCFIDNHEDSAKKIMDRANIARKASKDSFNREIEFYDTEMRENIKERLSIEEDMEDALKNKEFVVYLQPKVNMITGKLYGAEALVRWDHKTKGLLSPSSFIHVFEENGFILELDYYMYEQVCVLKKKWKDMGKRYPIVSVNMSRLHIYDKNFIYKLVDIAAKYEVPPQELEIEITENAFLEDSQTLLIFTDDLKRAGFKVSIDDFGSGYSSLNMLKDISADVLKIDRQFLISTDKNDGRGKKILKNIIAMARDLKIDIVTEGVETTSQIELLTNYGCEVAQGFYYAKPMSVEEYEIFASVHGEFLENACLYRLDGTYTDEYDGEPLKIIGTGFKFVDDLIEGRKVLEMPGGQISENYIQIPNKYLSDDSFTISIWLKTGEVFTSWSSLIYAEYDTGFMSYMPVAWNGSMSFRILDNMYAESWHDTHYPAIIKKHQWYNVVITYSAKLEATRLYVNGEAVGYRGNVPPLRGIRNFYLGGDIYQPSMPCLVADLMVSDQVKTSSEIRQAYQDMVDRM